MAQLRFRSALQSALESARRFRDDESGAMAFLMISLFVIMMMIGGIAVDVMRFETRRVAMQQTMDRAALAAASLTQTRSATDIANDWFAKASLGTGLDMVSFSTPVVTATTDAGLRRVKLSSSVRSKNFFMHLLDVDYLEGPTNTEAAQGVSDIEVMLVLDITGSMSSPAVAGETKSKIAALRESAAQFVTIVKGNDSKNGVSIGVVPYASQVNLPAALRARFTVSNLSSWNGVANQGVPNINCLEVPASTYTSMALSRTTAYPMAGVADFASVNEVDSAGNVVTTSEYRAVSLYPVSTEFGRSVCGTTPDNAATTDNNEATDNHVLLPTKSAAPVIDAIEDLTAAGNTSIAIGMRWGTALIDQSARPIYTALGDTTVQGRPADNSSLSTRKIIILMTDGEHVANNHIRDTYKTGASPIYRGADGKFAIRFWSGSSVPLNTGTRPHANCSGWVLSSTREYFIPHLKANAVRQKVGSQAEGAGTGTLTTAACDPLAWKTTPSWTGSGTVTQLDWSEVWRYMRVEYLSRQLYMRSNVSGTTGNSTNLNTFRTTYISVSNLNNYLSLNCTAAKAAGVEIYGIAFAAPTNGQTQISNCSSEPKVNYYYDASNNALLTAAFNQIATDISDLRLTQ